MSKLDKILLTCARAVGLIVAATLVGLPFVLYQDLGFSSPSLVSALLLLFVVLVVWCGS
jgi:hypothetical protein